MTLVYVVEKFKRLKKPIRRLMRQHGNLQEQVRKLRLELDRVQADLDKDPDNSTLQEEEAIYLTTYNEALLNEEQFLKQKYKVQWLIEGDGNTGYFHKVVKAKAHRS